MLGGSWDQYAVYNQTPFVAIANTDYANSGGLIALTVKRNKGRRTSRTLHAWKKNCGREGKEQLAILAKIGASEIPAEVLQVGILSFLDGMSPWGFGLYSVDYMQDFSGVLDCPTLLQHLMDNSRGCSDGIG